MISNVIENKIIELERLLSQKDSINDELKTVNSFLEILNKLNEEMLYLDIPSLMRLLEKHNFEVNNLNELFTNVNILIEYYTNKGMVLKLPSAYGIKIDEIKNNLKEIKNKLENSLIDIFPSEQEIDLLKKALLIITKEDDEIEITKEMLKVLYEKVIVDLDEDDKISLYELLYDYTKKELSEEEKITNELIDLFKDNLHFSKIKTFILGNQEELLKILDIEEAKSIINFFKEKGIIYSFDPIALVYVSCYGKYDNIVKVYEELMNIKKTYEDLIKYNNKKEPFPYDSFCNLLTVSSWLNPPIEKTGPSKKGRKPNDFKPVLMPEGIKNKNQNMANISANIKLICGDLSYIDLDSLSIEKLFNNSVIRDVQPYVLRKNLEVAKAFNLHKLNISALKTDIEKRVNYAIELGLLKVPRLNSSVYRASVFATLIDIRQKNQFEGLPYFEYNTSNLSNFTEKEFAYYTSILSKFGRSEMYKKFYNSNHSINNHRNAKIDDSNCLVSFLNEEDLDKKENDHDYQHQEGEIIKIENFKEYASVLDEDENKYISFNGHYFDPEIVYENIVGNFERDFSIKDVDNENEIDNTDERDEYVYMFKNKMLSRYRVLRNASILKQRYGELTADMFLTCIVKDSFITAEEYMYLRNSEFYKEASFIERR